MKEVESFELDHGTKVPTDDKAIDNVMEESEEWEAPQISSSSSFYESIASRIYKDFNSGVRELYNNEARACRTARDKFGSRPRIEVKIDCEERLFTLHGVDSLGISEEVFKQIIKFIGKSGNMSGNEVGMFGMGFVSYQMLTDFMTLDTWTREETEGSPSYTVFCREDLHTKKVVQKEPTLDTFGTRLQMILKNDVIIEELMDTVKACAKFSTVPTTIEITNSDDEDIPDQVYEIEQYKSVREWYELNNSIRQYSHDGAGIQEIQRFDKKGDGMESLFRRYKKINFLHHVHYEDDDIEFGGVLGTYAESEFNNEGKLVRKDFNTRIATGSDVRDWDDEVKNGNIFLVGVPIDDNLSWKWEDEKYQTVLNCMDWYINIKNERKYSPNANRDSLERKANEAIQQLVKDTLLESFSKYNIKSADDYKNSIYKPFYSDTVAYDIQHGSVLNTESMNILNTLTRHYPMVDNSYGKTLKQLLANERRIISLQSLRSDLMEMFMDHFGDDGIQFIRCKDHSRFPILEQWGVIIGDEYKAIHKLKIKRAGATKSKGGQVILDNKPCALTNNGRYNSADYFGGKKWNKNGRNVSSTIGQVNEQNECLPHRIIQFDNTKDEYTTVKNKLDWNHSCNIMCITRARKGLKVDTPEDFVQWYRSKKLNTTKGKLSLGEVEALGLSNIIYMSQGLPAVDVSDSLEEVDELLNKDSIGVWLDPEHVDRLGIYHMIRMGGIGYPKLKGKVFSLQNPNALLNCTKDKEYRGKDYLRRLSLGGGLESNLVERWLNDIKIGKLFTNEWDRLILDTMLTAVRNNDIKDESESSMTDIVIKRLNLK